MTVTIQTGYGGGSTGGITTIASGSIAAAATQGITSIPATYAALHLVVTGASSNTATRHMRIQVSTDNNSTVDSTAGNYQTINFDNTPTLAFGTEASICGTLTDQVAAVTINIDVYIVGYQGGAHLQYFYRTKDSGGTLSSGFGTYIGGTTAVNALRLLWSGTGNFDAGTYALYGVS